MTHQFFITPFISYNSRPTFLKFYTVVLVHGRTQRGTGVGFPREKLKNIYISVEIPSNTGLDPLKNHKPTKPAFNVGP